MFDLLGTETPLAVKFFIAFAVVLALIGITAWLVRRFGANRLGGAGRGGRQPRLAVIDAAPVDGRRRLVLIRRDNIEHLLMIGGPTDLVVEPNIVRAVGNRDVTREPGRVETTPRTTAAPAADSWPLAPINEPAPIAPARTYRAPATEEPWHAPEPGARPRPADSLTGLAAELSTRLNPPEPPAPRAVEPPPRVVAAPPLPPEPAPAPQPDHNLADMAQQLEAALRRPPENRPQENRPPVTDPLAAAPAAPRPAQRDYKLRIDPRLEPKFDVKPEAARAEPKFENRAEPKLEPRQEPRLDTPPPAPGKDVFDNLEEEMASLLGRPSGKT
jgi:hypothetical protein